MKKFFIALMMLPLPLFAEEPLVDGFSSDTANEELSDEELKALLLSDSTNGQQGMVFLEDAHAYINVPSGYSYLSKEKTQHLLTTYWGNPEDETVMGSLILDSAKVFIDVETAFLFYYEELGYVSDEDADSYSYDDILKELRESAVEGNKIRKEAGLNTYDVVGWASKPYYDKEKKVLNWAKHLRFYSAEGDTAETLNYDIRVLGRKGILTIQAVGDLESLQNVEAMKSVIIDNAKFNDGFAYADFDPSTDHIAEWGLGALVAGKLLAKAGIFAKLGIFLAKFWFIRHSE